MLTDWHYIIVILSGLHEVQQGQQRHCQLDGVAIEAFKALHCPPAPSGPSGVYTLIVQCASPCTGLCKIGPWFLFGTACDAVHNRNIAPILHSPVQVGAVQNRLCRQNLKGPSTASKNTWVVWPIIGAVTAVSRPIIHQYRQIDYNTYWQITNMTWIQYEFISKIIGLY